MSSDLNIKRQHQRQIIRNKYTSRKFHTEWHSIIKKYREEFSKRIEFLNYEIHLEKVDSFDTYYFLRCRCNEKHTTKKSSSARKRGKPVIFPSTRRFFSSM